MPAAALPLDGLAAVPRPAPAAVPPQPQPRLGQVLLDAGLIGPGDLVRALAVQARKDVRLGQILLAQGLVSAADLMAALAVQQGAELIDLGAEPPDLALLDGIAPEACLRLGFVPWRRVGNALVIVTAHPERRGAIEAALPPGCGPVLLALAEEAAICAVVTEARRGYFLARAEARCPEAESCRNLTLPRPGRAPVAAAVPGLALLLFIPDLVGLTLVGLALLALIAASTLKAMAALVELRHRLARRGPRFASRRARATIARLPVVSVLVPLHREDAVLPRLVERLGRLVYPRELLDVCLVVEELDRTTRAAIARAALPPWMRVIVVPDAPLKTKPRAMNYALDMVRGSIVGVYDAEDAPDPDQIMQVVRRFHDRGPEVACLQGVLDFYNPRQNWLARCFAIEYAAWFRVVLPGIERMGLPVPLGGTTVFFRRAVLEEIGAWDAHNVTEDADLGMRLVRRGYRCEFLPSVTLEEANCRAWPWVRQRSRWLKGYAMTWASHMRDPARLLRDLGLRRFIAFQVLFLATLGSFLLAPVLWSFWLLSLGVAMPGLSDLPPVAIGAMIGLFVASEAINIGIGLMAVSGRGHRFLMPWVPTLHLYFPLGAVAAYKALYEVMVRPFYWDKTAHGLSEPDAAPGLDRAA